MESADETAAPVPEPPPAPLRATRGWVMWIAVLFEGGAGLAAVLLAWLLGIELFAPLTGTSRDWQLGLAATGPLVVVMLLTARYPLGPIRQIIDFLDQVLLPLLRVCTLGDLVLISVLAGVGEELLFRGVIQQGLTSWIGPAAAIAVCRTAC
jgi:membrane protease YdiL (CAAX protease family)